MNTHDYPMLPTGIQRALSDYATQGVPLGDFLRCCVANDFCGAACRADNMNKLRLQEIALYIVNNLPAACRGSDDAYEAWIEKHAGSRGYTRP